MGGKAVFYLSGNFFSQGQSVAGNIFKKNYFMENGGIVGDCRQVVKKGDFFFKDTYQRNKNCSYICVPV